MNYDRIVASDVVAEKMDANECEKCEISRRVLSFELEG
jgi:hypothetical protein